MSLPFHRSILLLSISLLSIVVTFAQRKSSYKKMSIAKVENNAIKNGIQLKTKGFLVTDAYLVLDDESILPEGNKVELNQNVNMLLIIDGGWTEKEGRVFPGSKQIVKLSNGVEVSNSGELFEAFDQTGVASADARYITLNAGVPDLKDKKNYAIVNFKVWDKLGSAEISGSYKLYIK